jgi:hypothetical protein
VNLALAPWTGCSIFFGSCFLPFALGTRSVSSFLK